MTATEKQRKFNAALVSQRDHTRGRVGRLRQEAKSLKHEHELLLREVSKCERTAKVLRTMIQDKRAEREALQTALREDELAFKRVCTDMIKLHLDNMGNTLVLSRAQILRETIALHQGRG